MFHLVCDVFIGSTRVILVLREAHFEKIVNLVSRRAQNKFEEETVLW